MNLELFVLWFAVGFCILIVLLFFWAWRHEKKYPYGYENRIRKSKDAKSQEREQ